MCCSVTIVLRVVSRMPSVQGQSAPLALLHVFTGAATPAIAAHLPPGLETLTETHVPFSPYSYLCLVVVGLMALQGGHFSHACMR
jgi:hypothetical protein